MPFKRSFQTTPVYNFTITRHKSEIPENGKLVMLQPTTYGEGY
jgi:hypothetical protein